MEFGNNIERFNTELNSFSSVSLKQIEGARLMNRFDSKYWFPVSQLPGVLNDISDEYYILEIGQVKSQQYRSFYYDTAGDMLYLLHHNGKLNRLKIRKREYTDSGIMFLELKLKSNKGKTNKLRIQLQEMNQELTDSEIAFIEENTGLPADTLKLKLANGFNRITLVHKDFTERCTIDYNLSFRYNGYHTSIADMAIVELKQGERSLPSKLAETLKYNGIYRDGFSKYCIGRALLQPEIKKNEFKPKLLRIKKEFNYVRYA